MAEVFIAPELGDMEKGFIHFTVVIQMNGDLSMSFQPADRIDRN